MFCFNKTIADEGDFAEGALADFCSPYFYNSYLRVYSILLGDVELDLYRDTAGLTILFVIVTLIGLIILLNVLIAVVSDSYERAQIGSARLFGRARVLFVAQNQALEVRINAGLPPVSADQSMILLPFSSNADLFPFV